MKWRRSFHRLGKAVAALTIALVLLRCWPHPSLARAIPLSTGVWSADGELLRVTRSADDQFRLWVPLAGISPPVFLELLLMLEQTPFGVL